MSSNAALVVILVTVVLALLGVAAFFLFAPGPRRWRAFHKANKLLADDAWAEALSRAEALLPGVKGNPAWVGRVKNLAGEAHQRATDHALKDRDFDGALDHALTAADYLGLDPAEQRTRIVDAMLAEVRRQFAG